MSSTTGRAVAAAYDATVITGGPTPPGRATAKQCQTARGVAFPCSVIVTPAPSPAQED